MKVVVCVSGGGSNLQSLIDAKAEGRLPEAELALVIASRPGIRALERAALAGIPSRVVRRADFADAEAYDAAMLDAVASVCAEEEVLIVLAGFLTKLGARFVARFPSHILNIHPSLLPAFGGSGFYGIRPHEAVLAYGCKLTGASVHLVDEDYDHGPVLDQIAVRVEPGDSPERLQARVMAEAERPLLQRCVRAFTEGRVRVEGRLAWIAEEGAPGAGADAEQEASGLEI